MLHIDEDTITQAVIARHAAAGDSRLREVMTSLVQHLHAFARDVKPSDAEWAAGLRFVAECARSSDERRNELALLSDTLGLSTLVTALNRRAARGGTEPVGPLGVRLDGAARTLPGAAARPAAEGEPCFVRGRVCALDGTPIAGAEVSVLHAGTEPPQYAQRTDAEGRFQCRCVVPDPSPIPHDGPVGQLLEALGRHPWRPAHLQFTIAAPGCEPLVTHVFRRGDRYLDSDAIFGVRSSLVADWVRHAAGRTPDGRTSDAPFTTLDFTFVLNVNHGDKP